MPTIDEAVDGVLGAAPPAQPGPKRDPIADAVGAVIDGERTQRRATMFDAVRVNPDEAAKAKVLERETGAPTDVILRNLRDVELQAAVEKYSAKIEAEGSNTLRKYYATSDFARMSHDDLNTLLGVDAEVRKHGEWKAWNGPKPTTGSVLYGLAMSPIQGFRAAREGLGMQMTDMLESMGILKLDEVTRKDMQRKMAQASGASDFTTPNFESGTARGLYGGGASLLRMLPGTALSVATRSPTPMLASAGLMTEAESYAKYRTRGATPGQAALGAVGEGAVEVATELLPSKFMTQALGKAGMGEFITGLLAREIPGEQAATLLQDAIDTAIANPGKTWAEYFAERPMAAYETLVATVTQSAVMGGISQTARILARDQAQMEDSERSLATFESLLATAGQSKLRERSPETFAQFVQEAAEQGGAPTAVYVDARALTDALNQAGITDEQLAQVMPDVPAQMANAFDSGGVVEIPIGQALAAAPGTPLEQVLLQNARLDPEGLSRVELDEATKQADKFIEQAADAIRKDAETKLASEEQVAQIRQTITDQLNTAGRFRPEANQTYATMVGAFYSTMAQRLGVTPAELYARYPLRVTGEMQAGALEQAGTPEFNAWFGDSKVVDAEGKPLVVYHGTEKAGFDVFDPARAGENTGRDFSGIYFTNHKLGAETYSGTKREANPSPEFDAEYDAKPGNYPVYLKMENPYFIDFEGQGWDAEIGGFFGMDEVVAYAQDAGFDGVVAENVSDEGRYGQGYGWGDKTFVVFKPEQIKSATKNDGSYDANDPSILSQQTRATFSPSQMLIALGPNADYSSFLHETGHFWLEVLSDIASQPGAPEQIVRDFNTTLEWFGIKGTEQVGGADAGGVLGQRGDEWMHGSLGPLEGELRPGTGTLGAGFYLTNNENQARIYPKMHAIRSKVQNPDLRVTRMSVKPGLNIYEMNDLPAGGVSVEKLKAAGYDGVRYRDELNIFDPANVSVQTLAQGGTPTESAPVQPQRTPMETWAAMTLDQKRPYHERWAESVEQYFFEGKAPSVELRGVFDRFRTWLMSVYKSLKNFLAMRAQTPGGQAGAGELAQSAPGTPAFDKWFGDSKVVDAEGKPLVVYHGTGGDFDTFSEDADAAHWKMSGFYFAPNAEDANRFAESAAKIKQNKLGNPFRPDGANVMPVYLSLQNPKVIEFSRRGSGGFVTPQEIQEMLDEAKFDGHDGAIIKGWQDGSGEVQYVAFRPEQIKSAIGNRGTFDPNDPNILNQSANEQRDLMVTHNLTAANLMHAVKMGGLPVPSLAITKKDTPLTGFGEITLIGDKNLADPKGYAGTKVYGADIYSPRYPSVERELDNKAVAALTKRVRPMADRMGDSPPGTSELQRDGQRELERSIAVMGTFLQEQGVEPNIVMRKGLDDGRRARLEEFGLGPFMDATSVYDLLDNEDFKKAALAETRDAYAKVGKREGLVKSLDTDEQFQRNVVRSVAQEVVNDAKLRARPEADRYATQQALEKQIADDELADTYQQWVQDELAKITKSERIFQGFTNSGNRKYIPHTLENVVKLLKKELRGGESFNYGVGSLRAKFTPEFKTLAAIKKEKGRLVSAEEFDATKKEVDVEFEEVRKSINPDLSNDTTIGILEDAAKMGVPKAAKSYGYEISDEAAQKAAQFLTRLRNLPTAYFEAKVLRDVSLSEFKGAVVPDGTDPKVLDALRAAGVTDVRTYAKGDEAARGEAIKQFDNLFFQKDQAQAGPLNLTDEIRAVMDRLLATDEQITEMERVREFGLLFKSPEEAGMTPEQWAAYTSADEKAHAEALTELSKRSLRDMGIVMRKRMRALKDVQRDMAEKRKAVEEEAAAVVAKEPVYQAMRWLKRGEMTTPEGEEVKVTNGFKLDAAAVDAIFPESMPGRPDVTKLRGMTLKKDGLDPAIVADMFGFRDAAHLITSIIEAFPQQSQVDGLTDQMMLERYGDLATPRGMERAADEAVHNENRARVLAAEMATISAANDARAPGTPGRTVNAMVQAAKQFAERLVEGKKVKDLKPQQHTAAETRAARAAEKALAKGDTQGVIVAKRDQLLNFHAAKATNEARIEAAKIEAFFKKVATAKDDVVGKTRDIDVVKAAQAILAAYDVGTKGKAANEYLDVLERNDPAMFAAVKPSIDAALANAKPMAELTMAELRALNEELQALWFLAKRSRQMEVDGNLLDIQEAAEELKARMVEIGIPDSVPGDTSAITPAEQRALKLKGYLAAARRVESWAQAKDGAGRGPFRRLVWEPVREAADAYRADKAKNLKAFKQLLDAIAPTLTKRQIEAPELGYTFGKDTDGVALAEILHALMHTGNDSNKRKLLLGRKWATENEDGTLDTGRWDAFVQRMVAEGVLQPAHFDFAQGVWDLLESMKPLAQKTHREVFGKYFAEVTANEFVDPFGTKRRGGYVPAQADARIVSDQATKRLMEDENASMQFAFPTTSKGFTKSRVDYNRPLLLDLRSLTQHIDKVLLFAHMEGHVRDVRKLLTQKGVAYALNRLDPVAADSILTPWLNRAAKQQVETPVAGDAGLMRFFSAMRRRAGMAAMFANVANAVQQVAGFSMAAVRVKPTRLASAMAQYVAGPREMTASVAAKSSYMATRMENEVANMTDAINDILIDPSVYERSKAWLGKHAYFVQSAVDNVMSPVIWTGAYNQALEQGMEDREAVRFADSTVRETQGSTAAEDVSRIETGNAFVRLFTQFAGYFNMQANLLGTEFNTVARDMGLRKGAGRALYVLLFGFLVNAWAAEAIMQMFKGGPGDDDKDGDYLDDWLAQVFGWSLLRNATAMVPVAGQLANSAVNSFNKKPYDDRIASSPAISMIESAAKAPNDLYQIIVEGKDKKPSAVIRDVATLITMTVGVPANALARPVGYLADVEAGKVTPTGPVDMARGVLTGTASGPSKN